MVETELVVKIASGGAGQTVRDVAKVQEALAKMGKSAKDAATLAQQLGKAFNLDPSEVEDLAKALQDVQEETEKAAESTGYYRDALGRLRDANGRFVKDTKQGFQDVDGAIQNTAREAGILGEVFTGFLRGLGEKGLNLAIESLQALGSAIVNVAGAALDEAKAFDDARAAASTLVNDTDALIVALEGAQSRLGNQVSTTELLAASYDILSSGFTDAADAAKIAEASARGAQAGFSDVATTSDALTTIINSYSQLGMTAADAEKIVDQLVKTQDLGKITLGQYADQIGRAASIAATAGVSFEEFSAAVATATAKGVPAESAVSGTRQAIVNLLKPTAEGTKLLAQFGIENSTATLRSEGLVGVLERLRDQGATTDQLSKIFSDVDALATVATLAGENLGTFQANLEGIAGATGVTDKNMQALTQTISGQTTALRNITQQGLLELGRAIEPIQIGLMGFANALLTATGEGVTGLDDLRSAAERFQAILLNNPEIVDRLAQALATLANEGVEQFSLLLDGITAFVAQEGNIDQVAQSLESTAVIITRLGQTARFIVALADSLLSLKTRFDELPPALDGVKQALDVTGATKGFAILSGTVDTLRAAFEGLNVVIGSARNFVQNLVERFEFLGNTPVIGALLAQITEAETAAGGLGTSLGQGLASASEAIGTAGQSAAAGMAATNEALTETTDAAATASTATEEAVSALNGLTAANRTALEDITTDSTNARAALLENGGTQAEVAAVERKALEDRVAQNRTYLQQLKDLQAAGGLSEEDATAVADAIRDVEGQLAQDRVTLAQQTLDARRDAEDEAANAAEEAAKRQQEAAEAAAKAQADALKESRDEAKRLAEEAFGDAQKEEGVIFSDAQAAKAEAFQEAQQADQQAFNDSQQANAKAFQQEQQAESKAFQESQQAAAKAFQRQLDAERDKGNREFDVLTSEVERRVQLQQAANAEDRRALEEQFALEDKQLEERRKIEAEVLRERGSILADRQEETQLGPLEQARADFEAQLQAKAEAFQLGQQAEREAFEAQQQLESEAFEAGQREAERIFQEEQKADAKAFRDAQKEEDRAFQAEQQEAERIFNEEQRRLDRENAQQIAAILESAKPRGNGQSLRVGGVAEGGVVQVHKDEFLVPPRGTRVISQNASRALVREALTAGQAGALMAGLPSRMNPAVPQISTGKLERQMAELLTEVKKGRKVQMGPQQFYLQTPTPQADAVAIQMDQLRQMLNHRGF